jgi:hypothetical protein
MEAAGIEPAQDFNRRTLTEPAQTLATIYRKIGVRNRTEATAFAYKSGLANT